MCQSVILGAAEAWSFGRLFLAAGQGEGEEVGLPARVHGNKLTRLAAGFRDQRAGHELLPPLLTCLRRIS